ncbi:MULTISPECIES: STAS domain-containing protein [Streptomyces]|uniref:Anti-sigma factor antagonist n=1 Tax=Streptomyces gilvifuscus TaxID=1550617 RepID=A0ABT5G666_9ACTN|nr:STAS domain-containing protein [Streptomyces gilvifuscus]MDC2960259.1 STAS domain-containing protein [Streptomyces gilvifuscus]
MNPLKISVRDAGTGPVWEITGALDYTTAPELCDQLTALTLRPGERLVLDLAGMDFCDSSGITALITAHNHTHAAQADLALAAVPPNTVRVLHMVGLDQVIPLYPDTDAATRP